MSFPSIFNTLVSAPEPVLRRMMACDDDTPAGELVLLANDADLTVRLAVARQASIPFVVFTVLVQDASALVRRTMASRHDVPAVLLAALVEDDAISVRLKLAEHPSLDEARWSNWSWTLNHSSVYWSHRDPPCLHPFSNDSQQIPMAPCDGPAVNV